VTPRFRVDVATALEGARVDVGEAVHCDGCDGRFHEGAPVTVIARTRSDGWDVEAVFGPQCAPDNLNAKRRDGESVALAEAAATGKLYIQLRLNRGSFAIEMFFHILLVYWNSNAYVLFRL